MWRALLLLSLTVCSGDERLLATRLAPNLALGQPVVLSSTARYTSADGTDTDTGDGFRATDGNYGTFFFSGLGCAETKAEPDPWMRVDLGREVPVAVVRLWTRTDSADIGLGPIDIRLGNTKFTWRENLACAEGVTLSQQIQPNMFNCLARGRYLFLVLRVSGRQVAPFSICEMEVTPKGPTGNKHVLQTAGGMWNLQLSGVALDAHDRIRIVPDTVLCGLTGSATMHSTVLALTSPKGARAHGDYNDETWENIQINRMGMYKVCWCGGDGGCTLDEHFSMHVATLIINGMMLTVAGNGQVPNRTSDMVDDEPAISQALSAPYGIAVSDTRIFFSERETHMIRYMNIEEGKIYTLAGKFFAGMRGDYQPAYNAELWSPSGLALDKDQRFLYIADAGSHRVRRIDLAQTPLNAGIIETVAGNGFKGRAEEGQLATQAELDTPTGVAVDLNQMLWICDSGNNVLRVVSMEIPVRIPSTNEFRRNIILTAAGGATGSTTKGDGGVAWLARMQAPSGVAVSSAFISNEDGTLPVNVYISEAGGQQVRTMSLEYQSYLGVINTLVGRGQRGNYTKEASPLEAQMAEMNEPSGVATDEGLVYISDSANHRLLMVPALEYVSVGCWRENIESPWIPSIEGQSLPYGINYLTGIPENRPDAITACAMATLRLGYEVFAIRQMGVCATSPDAHLYFRFEGSSTSCSEGKGGARDNSVYRFARQGMMTQQQGLVYIIAGRESRAGFSGDQGTAWVTELNRPHGLGVHPITKDLYVADSGNHRLRLIFRQVGPNPAHSGKCTNGFPCESDVIFQVGVGRNPTLEVPSPSFTRKTYNFGPPFVSRTGHYRLCFCVKDAVVFGQITPCTAPEFFIHDAGSVLIVGPDSRTDDAEVVEGMPGRPFSLAIFGTELSIFDRVRLVNNSQPCGVPGAEVFAEEVQSRSVLAGRRHLGNESFSLWANVTLKASGAFRLCWCQGARPDGSRLQCERGEDFRVEAARVNIRGPIQYAGTIKIGGSEEITVRGGEMAGFSSSDRIRLVDAATVQCGSDEAEYFSSNIDVQKEFLPSGPPHRITADSVTWTMVKVRSSQLLRVCWCGAPEGCRDGEDFLINAALIMPLGPRTDPPQVFQVQTNGTNFPISIRGTGLDYGERLVLVDDYTLCGTRFAGMNSLEVERPPQTPNFVAPDGTEVRWNTIRISRKGKYRICHCYCREGRDCCSAGEDFYTELGSVLVGTAETHTMTPLVQPTIELDPPQMMRPPGNWGEFPKDITRTVYVRTRTRSQAHAGSMGPIEVALFQTWPQVQDITSFVLTDLKAGETQGFYKLVLLDTPMNPVGIIVRSHSTDAWYGEWIEVEIEGLGMHRFAMDGWTVSPADRQARRITQGLRDPPLLPTIMPPPQVELWESHAFVLEPCGGCLPGFECMEEEAPMVDRLQREAELNLVYDEDGGVSDPEGAKRTVFRAMCRPICGDGVAQPGEQCDDGNLRSMDGCNGLCKVEQGFECSNLAGSPSSCWPRLCDGNTGFQSWSGRKGGYFPEYGAVEFAQMSSLGATCSVGVPLEFKAPPAWPKVCFQWKDSETYPPEGITNDLGLCPVDKTKETLLKFVFAPPDPATVQCQSYEMEYVGQGMDCNATRTWQPPAIKFETYDDCAKFCEMDQECRGVMFYVDDPTGGKRCTQANTLTCTAHCHLVDACDYPFEVPAQTRATPDQYHCGRKVQKSGPNAPAQSICTQAARPMPVFALFSGGIIIIQFDFMVEPPQGISLHQDFYCSHLLWATSQEAVGGNGAACRWVTNNVLHLRLGPEAVVARFESYDSAGWLTGNTAELFFDRSRLHPRGMSQEMFANEIPVPVAVSGRMWHPLETGLIGMPEVPQVIIRGPYDMGGCGDLEVIADTSSLSGGRRWKSVVWECLETRPDGTLPQESQDRLYSACQTRITPLMAQKPWCGLDFKPKGVAQTCELRVVIPSSTWCGLSQLTVGVTLTRADGYKAYGRWTTRILPLTRIPAAGAVGPTEVTVSPQRLQGHPVNRLRLEVSSESDAQMIGRCSCNLTRAPNPDGSESRVVVDWYYGEVKNGMEPRLFEMTKILSDESASANVLEIQLRGELMKPNSQWLFYARVAYAIHGAEEGSYVPFHISVGPLEAPMVKVNGPYRANNEQCSFVLDASGSRAREIMYSLDTLGRRLTEGEARMLQNSSLPDINSGLQYMWRVRQLAAGSDDQQDLIVPSAMVEIAEIENSRSSQLLVKQALLKEGLYVFTAEVYDALYPSLVAAVNTTVLVDKKENLPVIMAEGPSAKIGPSDPVEATFIQTCIVQTTKSDIERTHVVLLMRGIMGQPRSYMRAYKELTWTYKIRDIAGGVSNSLWIYTSADRADLQAGFVYSYRLLTSSLPKESFKLSEYKDELLKAGHSSEGPLRDLGVQPTTDVESIAVLQVDTEPFGMHWGPFAGTLDVLDPVGRIGIAMSDVFRLQQAWATDMPPLEYTFYYGEVPEEKRSDFMAELGNFETDILTDHRLSALVPENAMVPLSDWSQSPTLALPLKEGMYVFEGRARDATGLEAKKYMVAWSHPAYVERVITSYDRVTHLEAYMRRSRQAILQVRAFNRGSVSVVPVCAAVFALPDMYDYDFRSMVEWNPASGLPMPNLSQPIYGAPIVSRETRSEVIAYLRDIMGVLYDIIYALEPDSLGADTRRLQEQYWKDTTSNLSTPLHMEVVAGALAHLSANLAPIGDPELFVFLGTLTSGLVERVRGARGDIRKAGNAPQDLVKTLSYLLASTRPIDKPREGVLSLNISENVQARLSSEIIRTAVALGDVMAAIADPGGPPTAIKQAMPKGEFMNVVDGDLVVTIIKKKLIDIIEDGVQTQPDYQSMLRWIYPQINIAGLGPPGADGIAWAGDADILFNEAAKQCQEAQEDFLQTITMTTISWPISPFLYATGSLIGMNANVTVPYTVQMRSCGQPVVLQGASGKIQLTFRLSPDVVRDRRWGYGDKTPYRVAWWEDREDITAQGERMRRWTIHGCKTSWSRTQEDIVTAQCDRLPSSQGSVMAVELVPRPVNIVQAAPARNRNVHNIISYTLFCFMIRWTILLVWAYKADVTFWPSEKQLMKLLYLPWERKWRERLRRGRLPPAEPITWNPLINDFWFQTKMLWIERLIALFCAIKALRGSELFYSVEVRELMKMRSGDRDVTYERFVDSMNDKDQREKIQYVKEQRSLAAVEGRKAAWQDKAAVEAFQDQEVPASRRLPLHHEGQHGAPEPGASLAGIPGGGSKEEDTSGEDELRAAVMASLEAAKNSQEVILPAGWEMQTTPEGHEFYVNLRANLTQWQVPKLPPHWEERFSRKGEVYYLSLFDGRTQWEWPQENAAAFERRLEEAPAPPRTLALPGSPARTLALPGSTQEFQQEEPDDASSQASDESSLGIALDEVDANDLLAIPPGTEIEMTPRDNQNQEELTKWGADQRDAEWISLKRQMASQKKAHDERWLTAKHFPGVREFVRKYELANQANNWDRAVDNVTLKVDNAERQKGQLGEVAELRKEELRQIFPIVQRLQWTKWSGFEIFMHCVIREYPLQNALRNTVRPTKFHRTLLHVFRVIASLVGACIAVTFEAPVDEEVEATSTATWDLFLQAVTMPITGNTILCAFLGILFSSTVKRLVLRLFYRHAIAYNQRPTTSVEARKYQLRYWHELAEMGKWTCIIGSFLGFGSSVAMCMLTPQPRAAVAFQAFWLSLLGTHWLLPLIRGGACAVVLITARSKATFDGWLTVWPGFMNFAYVGVKTTEFMVWRAQRIVAEEELLLQVYPDMPSIGRKLRDPDEEEEVDPPQDGGA